MKNVFKTAFLLMVILSVVIFTPFASGQDLKKATWLERASVIYDQKNTNAITSSVIFETYNNNEILFSDQLLEKISSNEEVVLVTFTNMGTCVMGVDVDEQCIIVSMNYQELKGDGEGVGVTFLQTKGKKVADTLISDINSAFNLDTKFHSIWLLSPGSDNMLTEYTGNHGLVNAVYTMPKQETSFLFESFSESLISQDITSAGGFYDTAKHLASLPNATMTVVIIKEQGTSPMFLFKVSHWDFTFDMIDISQINPLGTIGVEKLERTKYFKDFFVPLNSVLQVLIFPIEPSKINSVETNVIEKLESTEDVSEKGWFFASTSYDKIDARFLFGTEKSVSANELVMTVQPETSVNDDFSVNSIQVNQQSDGEQYAVLVVIIVAAIGAAIFYLKGYKRIR